MRTLHSIPLESVYPPIENSVKVGISRFKTYWKGHKNHIIGVSEDGTAVYYQNTSDRWWNKFQNINNWNPTNYWGPETWSAHSWNDDSFSWEGVVILPVGFDGGFYEEAS